MGPSDKSDDAAKAEAILKALEPWRNKHRRTAWLPQVKNGPGPAHGSRFGGLPWLPSGESHPACGNCKRPLRLLLQLNLLSLPEEVRQRLGPGLLQAFYCEHEDCEQECDGWSPFSEAHRLRIIDVGHGNMAAPAGKPFPPKEISGWKQAEDLPSAAEHEELGLDFDYDFEANTVRIRCAELGLDAPPIGIHDLEAETVANASMGDKLLGWPHWIQGVEYPECPQCKTRMEYVFQIDSEHNLPLMWGDLGTAHITRCPNHPEVLALGWACG
ncbi:uncharacterized protein YwqG [Archangium gephyra]|uniref:Uncharacterized protein YwqG n=1 Tax=Archangium gephyra TaxID=48 RepID=A0AAC8TE48_9BACT|nr:DUF1963 domain-containing protein [Archangium gephyra]AKJ02473.1 Hypothetical protein AA314_04099 [Archangium gephyra]REG28604.1 uncharacterized protein YwqG [Archangium gephyra]